MYFEKITKLPLLQDLVETTWQSQINVGDSAFVTPDGTSDIIIKANSNSASIFLCGVMTRPSHFHYDENRKYFGIRFRPGFSSLFFNATDKTNQLILLDKIFSKKNQIEDLMQSPVENHFLIEALIFEQLLKGVNETYLREKIKLVTEYSKVQYGEVNAQAIKMNISRRQFSSNFKKYFGYDPRYFSKIKKFNAFLKRVSNNKKASLSELAIDCGFYDQSDLCHTVKEISGLTPRYLISQVYNTKIDYEPILLSGG
ncbi:MAG: AraC family transcriptional regulator [Bacteriovoracaceae bacterium]|jgi:AraC-like DNA-binding protein|nr:AraC family transcriptional regulator [Bacteriovoracaceae bacterium]